MYTLLYFKQITNKDLLCSTGNSAQYSVLTLMEKEFEKTIGSCITESLFCITETKTTLLIKYVCILSRFSHVWLFATLWTWDCSLPGSSVHGLLQASILEWPCPSPRDLPNPGIEHASLMSPALAGGFFINSAPWEALINCTPIQKLKN